MRLKSDQTPFISVVSAWSEWDQKQTIWTRSEIEDLKKLFPKTELERLHPSYLSVALPDLVDSRFLILSNLFIFGPIRITLKRLNLNGFDHFPTSFWVPNGHPSALRFGQSESVPKTVSKKDMLTN